MSSQGPSPVHRVVETSEPPAPGTTADLVEAFVHAVRNPLFSLRLDLHTLGVMAKRLALGRPVADEFLATVRQCDRQLDRVEQFLKDLAEFACPLPADGRAIEVREELGDLLGSVRQWAPALEVAVTFRPTIDAAWILMDPLRFEQTITGLVIGACDAANSNELAIDLSVSEDMVDISIENPCWETSSSQRSDIFEPFARMPGREPGLQLALAKRNVEQAQGVLSCVAGHEGGSCFCVRLPLYAASL